MAKGSAKKSFLDLFKITDSNDDDFDDDMFDDEDEMEDEYDDSYDEAYDSEEEYDDGSYAASDRAKASPLKSLTNIRIQEHHQAMYPKQRLLRAHRTVSLYQ